MKKNRKSTEFNQFIVKRERGVGKVDERKTNRIK